jgi:hypothetical protein
LWRFTFELTSLVDSSWSFFVKLLLVAACAGTAIVVVLLHLGPGIAAGSMAVSAAIHQVLRRQRIQR